MRHRWLAWALALCSAWPGACGAAEGASARDRAVAVALEQGADQVFLVVGTGGTAARASLFERAGDQWEETVSAPAWVGKKGFGKTKEGDMKTPVGTFRFTMAFGVQPDPGCPMGYVQVDGTHWWCGDSSSPLYNKFVSTRDHDGFSEKDSEHLIDYPVAYAYALDISYNEEGRPGAGSAIFLHCQTKNHFTAGCVAIPRGAMIDVLQRVRDGCLVVIDAGER